MSFLSPSPPPPPAPAAPSSAQADAALAEARRKEKLAARLRVGRAATILTGGAGLAGLPGIARKKLLGE